MSLFPPNISDALLSLAPDASWSHNGDYESIVWCSDEVAQPTKRQVNAELKRLAAAYEGSLYRRNRAPEYPPIGDQLDDLFHAGLFSAEMSIRIQEVKDRFPKADN